VKCAIVIIKYLTTAQRHCNTTLLNIIVRKLACCVHCGSLAERHIHQSSDMWRQPLLLYNISLQLFYYLTVSVFGIVVIISRQFSYKLEKFN